MAMTPRTLRVPETANARILGDMFPIQTNHCRTPGCANFGVPARTRPGKRGPSKDRDPHYALISTSKGQEPALRCKACNGKGAIRSNAATAEEVERIADYARPLKYRFACKTGGCANEGLSIGEHRQLYTKYGYYKTPENPIYRCKSCLRNVLVSHKAPRIHARNQSLAADVFSRIANKSPMRRTVEGAGLRSHADYYTILDFIHRRCCDLNSVVTRSFLTGERRLPAGMNIAIDSQSLMVNWPSRVQRRTVEMTSCCSVDAASRFILELDVNHDPRFDPFDVNHESAERGDLTRKEAFRKYARFWLAGDEMRSGRTGQRRMGRQAAEQAVGDIQEAFRAANAYEDVAGMEIVPGQGPLRDHMLRSGMLVKTGYRTLGHMFVLREILKGAGVERLQLCMDQHLSTISSFIAVGAGYSRRRHRIDIGVGLSCRRRDRDFEPCRHGTRVDNAWTRSPVDDLGPFKLKTEAAGITAQTRIELPVLYEGFDCSTGVFLGGVVALELKAYLLVPDFHMEVRRVEGERPGLAVVHSVVVVNAIAKRDNVGIIHGDCWVRLQGDGRWRIISAGLD